MTNIWIFIIVLCGVFFTVVNCYFDPEKLLQAFANRTKSSENIYTKKSLIRSTDFNDLLCENQIMEILENLIQNNKWAYEVFDAWGKLPSGILAGNLFELGNYDQCLAIKHDTKKSDLGIINGQYCLLSIKLSDFLSLQQTIGFNTILPNFQDRDLGIINFNFNLGTCWPSECSADYLHSLIAEFSEYPILNFNQDMCYQRVQKQQYSALDIFAICLFSTFGFLMITSTLYDLLATIKQSNKNKNLIVFSMYTNGEKLFKCTKSNSPDMLDCLNGIRSLSIIWIVFGHTHMIKMMSPNINLLAVSEWPEKVYSTFILGAPIAVDTFFLLSGILVIWSMMKHLNEKGRINIFLLYLHRYLRLTPALAAGILFTSTLAKHLVDGPMHHMLHMIGDCSTHWWSALLYIQNFVNKSELCFGHSWYLSTDMQLFILSPILIYPLWRWRNKILWILPTLTIVSIICNFVIFIMNDFTMKVNDLNQQKRMEETYYPIYTRMGVYIIGLLLGYILYNMKGKPIRLPMFVILLFWLISLASIFAIIMGVYPLYQSTDNEQMILNNAFYAGFSRAGWGLALAWLIFACVHGYGGPINWFLSLPQWQPISRLSYSIYLVHYPIQVIMMASVKTTGYFNEVNMIHTFWGDLGFSLTVAIFWTLAFESPILVMEKLLLRPELDKKTVREPSLIDNNNSPVSVSVIRV